MDHQLKNNVLALHYAMPLSLPKLQPILFYEPLLKNLFHLSPQTFQNSLNFSEQKSFQLAQFLKKHARTSFIDYYAERRIVPITIFDEAYPHTLKNVYDPPAVLYAKGQIDYLKRPLIAVIGSRKATDYTANILKKILPPLLKEKFGVVSGLAKGADKMAHEVTILLEGATIGVLGYGFDYVYPIENKKLFQQMMQEQLLLTEYPPYVSPRKFQFPMRNRIISGLSSGVIVTEAQKKSGTQSTVDYALAHGRDIFVVPGNIFSPFSEFPHKLASEGAKIVWNGEQILEEIQYFSFLK